MDAPKVERHFTVEKSEEKTSIEKVNRAFIIEKVEKDAPAENENPLFSVESVLGVLQTFAWAVPTGAPFLVGSIGIFKDLVTHKSSSTPTEAATKITKYIDVLFQLDNKQHIINIFSAFTHSFIVANDVLIRHYSAMMDEDYDEVAEEENISEHIDKLKHDLSEITGIYDVIYSLLNDPDLSDKPSGYRDRTHWESAQSKLRLALTVFEVYLITYALLLSYEREKPSSNSYKEKLLHNELSINFNIFREKIEASRTSLIKGRIASIGKVVKNSEISCRLKRLDNVNASALNMPDKETRRNLLPLGMLTEKVEKSIFQDMLDLTPFYTYTPQYRFWVTAPAANNKLYDDSWKEAQVLAGWSFADSAIDASILILDDCDQIIIPSYQDSIPIKPILYYSVREDVCSALRSKYVLEKEQEVKHDIEDYVNKTLAEWANALKIAVESSLPVPRLIPPAADNQPKKV